MSFKKAALEKTKGHTKNACLHYWQAVRGVDGDPGISRRFYFTFGLTRCRRSDVGAGANVSTAPYLDANGFTVFTATPNTSGTCAAGTANGTCIFYVSDSDGNDCNDGLSAVANPRGCGAGPLKTLLAGYKKI